MRRRGPSSPSPPAQARTDPPPPASSSIAATVKGIFQASAFVDSTAAVADADKPLGLLLDQTCFYAESGGQENDTGTITLASSSSGGAEAEFMVTDVQVFSGYVLHIGTLLSGSLAVGDSVVAAFDELRRAPLRRNHTATHVLNYALREVLGDHIDQKGSLVAPSKLRFDFSHKQPITPSEMAQIENVCRGWIARDVGVFSSELPLETGFKIPGLRAVFGEAYPDPVRVVTLEHPVDEIAKDPENPKWRSTSVEFCGGT